MKADIRIVWPSHIKRWGIPQPDWSAQTIGHGFAGSEYVTLGAQRGTSSIDALGLVPVVTIQITGNPRATWLLCPLLIAEWQVRPVDFVAIGQHLTRLFAGVSVLAASRLSRQADGDYTSVPPPPWARQRR